VDCVTVVRIYEMNKLLHQLCRSINSIFTYIQHFSL